MGSTWDQGMRQYLGPGYEAVPGTRVRGSTWDQKMRQYLGPENEVHETTNVYPERRVSDFNIDPGNVTGQRKAP